MPRISQIVTLLVASILSMPCHAENGGQATSPADQIQFQILGPPDRKPAIYDLVRGVIIFGALLEDRKVWAILDNRMTSSLVDTQTAQTIGLPLSAVIGTAQTPTGKLERRSVANVRLAIPGQLKVQTPISAVDLSAASNIVAVPVSLVMGKEYFDNLEFLFTPGDRHFQLGRSGSLKLAPDTPFVQLQNDRPQIAVTIDGHPILLTIDLGFHGGVALNQQAWRTLGLDRLPLRSGRSANLEGTVQTTKIVEVPDVLLGSVHASNVQVTQLATFKDDGDGLIGFGLLSRYNFALDIKSRKLWLISLTREMTR